MKTSYFARISDITPGAIAISLRVPPHTTYLQYPKLAPNYALLKRYKQDKNEKTYTIAYFEQLRQLDAQKTWNELHEMVTEHRKGELITVEPILLCYENPEKFCHRRLVAQWFKTELGVTVPEYQRISKIFVQPCLF